jgi:hypothetical protein
VGALAVFPKDVNDHVTRDLLADDHVLNGGVCLGQQDALLDVRVGRRRWRRFAEQAIPNSPDAANRARLRAG